MAVREEERGYLDITHCWSGETGMWPRCLALKGDCKPHCSHINTHQYGNEQPNNQISNKFCFVFWCVVKWHGACLLRTTKHFINLLTSIIQIAWRMKGRRQKDARCPFIVHKYLHTITIRGPLLPFTITHHTSHTRRWLMTDDWWPRWRRQIQKMPTTNN